MAEFLTTQGTSYHIENIITSAKKDIILISPYLQFSKTLFERLKDADNRNVEITLIYGKDELKPSERSKLQQLKNLTIYFCENLHAKCFFNEESMVITSMNMYEFSEKNNREMGVLIRAKDDENVFREALREAQSIARSSIKEELSRPKGKPYSRRTKQTGYCIRCKTNIHYNLDAPYCPDCYEVWAKWKDPDYVEPYCHTCGKAYATTIEKPTCSSCYWSQK